MPETDRNPKSVVERIRCGIYFPRGSPLHPALVQKVLKREFYTEWLTKACEDTWKLDFLASIRKSLLVAALRVLENK